MAIEMFQRMGDWWGQRKQFRADNLRQLREREGIPSPELHDGRWQYRDANGNLSPWAVGKVKGMTIAESDDFWGGYDAFTILDRAEDGVHIDSELKDLDRDAALVDVGMGVSFGPDSEPNPEFKLPDLEDGTILDAIARMEKK